MKKLKTVKSFLKICLAIANTDRDELTGINKLSKSEYSVLGTLRAEVQNELGEHADLLAKYNLEYVD